MTRFAHPAWFYTSDEDYLAALVPFITDGLAAGDPVAAAVPTPRLDLLRDALGGTAREVYLQDMAVVGANPGRILSSVLTEFADRHPDRHVRIVGEPVWGARDSADYPACVRHEALTNLAFADRHATILCPYDVAVLPPHVLADARVTHPEIWSTAGRDASDHYAPDQAISKYNLPIPHPAHATTFTVTTPAGVRAARTAITRAAAAAGLDTAGRADLEIIVTELATNSLTHGGGHCEIALWTENALLLCSVSDAGRFTNPLAGTTPLTAGQPSGRGLWLVHHLAHLVRVHTTEQGTTIRAYLELPTASQDQAE
ncbi:anti-sigma factor RsbA family regulatory protein [Actinokineospora terrae]|uniref:Anti-sigma regulatory factor (Ser/Thr protein kinase) n=1 Tax=Actinokineospora terrae TaxID=155974 RepID=A0A1H9MIN6_9PSEU|nr:anti-sigma factor RsbA family regulatory protein [Actinokineospora terrae]SER23566.1 Anti-sigma regulatory factor (Ser/Thr protein kinase) [Actinokineospora terrae]